MRGQTVQRRTHVRASRPARPSKVVKRVPAHARAFAAFWDAYPKKEGKDAALKAWTDRMPDAALVTVMLAAVGRQKSWPEWTMDGGRYVPSPASWLIAGRWEDTRERRTKYCLRYRVHGSAESVTERCDSMTERALRKFELAGQATMIAEWLESGEPEPCENIEMARYHDDFGMAVPVAIAAPRCRQSHL